MRKRKGGEVKYGKKSKLSFGDTPKKKKKKVTVKKCQR